MHQLMGHPKPEGSGRVPHGPEFPGEANGFQKLHAPFLKERRTRGLVQGSVQEIRGVRPSVHGPKTDSSNAFTSCARILDLGRCLCAYTPKALGGLRPSYSAHVRPGEHRAPVRLPSAVVMTEAPRP